MKNCSWIQIRGEELCAALPGPQTTQLLHLLSSAASEMKYREFIQQCTAARNSNFEQASDEMESLGKGKEDPNTNVFQNHCRYVSHHKESDAFGSSTSTFTFFNVNSQGKSSPTESLVKQYLYTARKCLS